MLRFKQFIIEGGNVQIGDVSAERIDLSKIDRDRIVDRLTRTLRVVNLSFQKISGLPLWEPDLFKSKQFLSGSAFHFFNKAIATPEFKMYKNTVGDIDTQVDKAQKEHIKKFLDASEGKKFGYGTLIGYKASGEQYITLWRFDDPAINIQIDIELVDFFKGKPTEWSQFSHSSAWEDMKEGVKGAFQKYLLRAFTTKTLRDIIILKGKKEVPTKVKSTDLAFSVTLGLREKIKPVMDGDKQRMIDGLPVYTEIATKDSTYTSDLKTMFTILFGTNPSASDMKDFASFMGGLRLANKYFTPKEKEMLIVGFSYTLFGPGAQGLYRGDPEQDHKEKSVALKRMLDTLKVSHDQKAIDKMRSDYYASYR